MILRHKPDSLTFSYALLLLSIAAVQVSADDNFDCHITSGDLKYDLTELEGVKTITHDREAPPTKYTDTIAFNLCNDIPKSDAPEKEQCPSGTRACLTKTNIKDGDNDRVTEVVQLATGSSEQMSYETLSAPSKGISLTFKGPSYPDPYTGETKPQSFNVRILCDTDTKDPTFTSYDGAAMWIEWHAKAGCPMGAGEPAPTPDPNDGDGNSENSVGSGLGYFFLLLLVAFFAYFGLGAYYNYSTYGATGLDLIPHRDFWREVPYMLRDVVSHLCSSVRSRQTSTRGGYIAV